MQCRPHAAGVRCVLVCARALLVNAFLLTQCAVLQTGRDTLKSKVHGSVGHDSMAAVGAQPLLERGALTLQPHALPIDLQVLLDGAHPFGLEARQVRRHLHLRQRRRTGGREHAQKIEAGRGRALVRCATACGGARACSALRFRLIASIWPASSSRTAASPELATSSELRWASHVFAPCFCSSSRFVSLRGERCGNVSSMACGARCGMGRQWPHRVPWCSSCASAFSTARRHAVGSACLAWLGPSNAYLEVSIDGIRCPSHTRIHSACSSGWSCGRGRAGGMGRSGACCCEARGGRSRRAHLKVGLVRRRQVPKVVARREVLHLRLDQRVDLPLHRRVVVLRVDVRERVDRRGRRGQGERGLVAAGGRHVDVAAARGDVDCANVGLLVRGLSRVRVRALMQLLPRLRPKKV